MNEEVAIERRQADEVLPRRRWFSRLAKWAIGILLALGLAAAALMVFLDTDAGHRFLADRVAALSPSSGLKIRIGGIEGSIWSETRLRDVRIYDPRGLFAESRRVDDKAADSVEVLHAVRGSTRSEGQGACND